MDPKKEKNKEWLEACERGDLASVRAQIKDVDIHTAQDFGFRLACGKGHLDIVKYLLTSPELKEAGHTFADVHSCEDQGLSEACYGGHLDVVKYLLTDPQLLEAGHTFAKMKRGGGRHVLADACKMGHLEVVKYLLTSEDLKKAGHAPVDFSYQNNFPVYIACEYGHLELVKYLLASQELYEKRGFLAKLDQEDFTDIVAACANENWPIVRWLIMDYEMDLNSARLMDDLEMFPQAMNFVRARQEKEILREEIEKESHAHCEKENKEDVLKRKMEGLKTKRRL